MNPEKYDNRSLVIQHNKLIQAKYSLSLQEKKFVLWLVSQISPYDEDFKHYHISIKELAKSLGMELVNDVYKRMAEITERLMKRIITIEMLEAEKLVQIAWLRYTEYEYGKGVMKVGFAPELMPYLLQLKSNFTQVQLNIALSLSSVYAVRLYELLKQYEKIGYRKTSIGELKNIFGITENEYSLYSNFKIRVIQIAQREINAKTDLHIEIEEIKTSRKVTELVFHISSNPNHEATDSETIAIQSEPIQVSPELLKALRYLGLSQKKVLELAATYGEDTLQKKLKDFQASIDAGKEISNPAGWLISAIEKDWNYKSPFQLEQEQKEREESERLERERQAEIKKSQQESMLKAKRLEFDKFTRALFLSRWSVLPSALQDTLVSQANFNDAQRRSYTQNGVEKSPSSMAKLMHLLLKEHERDFGKWLETNPI